MHYSLVDCLPFLGLTEKRKVNEARRRERELREQAEAAGLSAENIHVNPGDVDWLYGDVTQLAGSITGQPQQKEATESSDDNVNLLTNQTPEVPEEYIEEEIPVDGVTAGAGDLGEMPRMHPREGPLMAARIIEDICDELAVLRQKREAQSHLNGQCSDTNPSESETELEIGNGPEEYHEVSGINGQADEGLVSTEELENNLLDTECENRKEQEEPLMVSTSQDVVLYSSFYLPLISRTFYSRPGCRFLGEALSYVEEKYFYLFAPVI